jgi:hypothetical protein
VLLSVLLSWIGCLWLSLFLMLASHPGSVIDSTARTSADLWETFYYAGFTLSTLGVGDYAASGDGWRVLASAAAFCGLTFITAAISYFVPVLSAVSLQYQISIYVSSMGRTPQEIVVNSWNGSDFSSFYTNASELCQMLMTHRLNHHSYPVIHYFHDSDACKSIIPAIVTLDAALQLLDRVSTDVPQDLLKRKMVSSAINEHLGLLRSNYLPRELPPATGPVVELRPLEEAGIPLKPAGEAERQSDERRSLLGALLEADGWHWNDVYGDCQQPATPH